MVVHLELFRTIQRRRDGDGAMLIADVAAQRRGVIEIDACREDGLSVGEVERK